MLNQKRKLEQKLFELYEEANTASGLKQKRAKSLSVAYEWKVLSINGKIAKLVVGESSWYYLEIITEYKYGQNCLHVCFRPADCPEEHRGHYIVNMRTGIIFYKRPPLAAHGRQNYCNIPLD